MEERQVPVLDVSFTEAIRRVSDRDEDDAVRMAAALNILLFRTGSIDGTYEPDAELYRFVMDNYSDMNRYLFFMGLRLMSDSTTRQVWLSQLPEDEGRMYTPFTQKAMNGAQMILLAILQQHLATGASSEEAGADSATGVLLTETDILQEMFRYFPEKKDDKTKKNLSQRAINRFSNELGLLRIVAKRLLLSDGTYSVVYRINPIIQHQFDIIKMDELLRALNKEIGAVSDGGATPTDKQDMLPEEDELVGEGGMDDE